jgi:hypothetical protein
MVVAEAERIMQGDWYALGARVRVMPDTVNWRAHPVSLVPTPAVHFSRVSCAAEVLGGDVKYLWEVNRHSELVRLAQAYWLTRRPEFAQAAVALLDSWIVQNPPGIGINWFSTLDVAFRAIAWCWTWALTADSPVWTDERIGRFLWTVAQCGRFIARYDSVHHSPNTHLTGEALGLIYIGAVFPELRHAARWRSLGARMLTEEVSHQFLADGMHYERSTGYHRYHLEFYLHALAIARGEAWADAFRDPVSRGADVSVHLRRPDGTWPVFGDEDGGTAVRLGTRDVTDQSDLLVVASGLLDRPELRARLGGDVTGLAWWMLDDEAWQRVTTAAGQREPPPSFSLGAAGYYGARDDFSDRGWYCVVDAGPHGGDATGHAHTDLGHVEIAHGERWLTVDPGSPLYSSNLERRNWFRGQRAHATVMIDGVELAVPSTPFGWRTVAPTPVAEVEDHDSYWHCRLWYTYSTPRGPVRHERHVILVRTWGVIVCDFLRASGLRALDVRWPLGVGPSNARLDVDARRLTMAGSQICWEASAGARLASTVEPTQRSPTFGVEKDASSLVLTSSMATLPLAVACAFTSDAEVTPTIEAEQDLVTVVIRATGRTRPIAFRFVPGMKPSPVEVRN